MRYNASLKHDDIYPVILRQSCDGAYASRRHDASRHAEMRVRNVAAKCDDHTVQIEVTISTAYPRRIVDAGIGFTLDRAAAEALAREIAPHLFPEN